MTRYRHEVAFSFEYPSEEHARTVYRSLYPEIGDLADTRSKTVISTDNGVTIHIEATDLVALRAAANTWLTFVDVVERTIAVARDPS